MAADERPDLIVPPHGRGRLTPPWTPEQAREVRARPRAKAKYSLRGALAKRLKARRPDGSRPWDDALAAFVEKLKSGDPRAIELAMESVDGPQATVKRHEHAVARDLIISRPRVVDAQVASAAPELQVAHDIDLASDNRSSVARDSEPVSGAVEPSDAQPSNGWTDGTD